MAMEAELQGLALGQAILDRAAAEGRTPTKAEWLLRAEVVYSDTNCPETECDYCGRLYRGPSVCYCSLACAIADADAT